MKEIKIILPLYSDASRSAMSIGGFSFKGFSPELLPVLIDLKGSIIQKFCYLRSCKKVRAMIYIYQLLTVIFNLKGKYMNTTNGCGYLGIGS